MKKSDTTEKYPFLLLFFFFLINLAAFLWWYMADTMEVSQTAIKSSAVGLAQVYADTFTQFLVAYPIVWMAP